MAQTTGKPKLFFDDVEISGDMHRLHWDELSDNGLQFSEPMNFDSMIMPVSFTMPTTTTLNVTGISAELIAGFDSNEIVCEVCTGNRWWSKCRRTRNGITKLRPDGSVDVITSGEWVDRSDYRPLARFLRWLEWHCGLFRWVLRGIPRGSK